MPEESERVLLVAPFGHDADAAVKTLKNQGRETAAFDDLRSVCEDARTHGVGVIVVVEECLTTPQLAHMSVFLEEQPPWSDLPIIVLARERIDTQEQPTPRILQRFNVTILERPLAVTTLLAAVQVALRARRRQYEVRSLLEQQRKERMRAESASRAKDDFLAMLGHELRNPLSPIATAVHLIRLQNPPKIERELTILDRQVKHLSRLVDDLLDVSRIAQGKVDVKHDALALGDVISRAVEMATPIFEQRRHTLTVSVGPDLRVCGDAVRLAQVFANLLTNAAKYTQPDGTVAISAAREGDEVIVRVKDSGVGITKEMLPRVFDLFAQERQAMDRSNGGLGLGLAIVHNLVALHDGTVKAESEGLGKGSLFTVRLPAFESSHEDAAVHDEVSTEAASDKPRILVVDDNEDAADMLAITLTASGYSTCIAHDGPDALRLAGEFHPDVAVLDIGLPVMDGYELANRLKRMPALESLRMIALTGYGQQEDVRRALAAGFDEHMVKPVNLDRLQATVSRLLAVTP